jgi:sugar phosphate isomerase/epimerase
MPESTYVRDCAESTLKLTGGRAAGRLLMQWLCGLTLLASVFVLAASAPVTVVPLGPQQTVRTVNPKIGIHTRLTDEVEPAKIKRTLEMVREMGAQWIVEYFPWAYIEPLPGIYDWQHADLVVDHANRQGLTVIARLGMVPQWARPDESATSFLDEAHYPDFARFVGAFVAHFRDRVDYVIIWNEPNLALEWGFQPVDPAAYTHLLRIAAAAARSANPGVHILAGALAPTLAPTNSEWGMNDLEYLRRMLEAGAADHFDLLAVHAYGWVYPPDSDPAPDVVNFRRVELLHRLLAEQGAGDKPVIITEGGWNDHPRWTHAVKPAQRIQYTIRAYQLAQDWPWCRAVVLWAFRYPWPAMSYLDYFTFVASDFTPKPLYLEVQHYAVP